MTFCKSCSKFLSLKSRFIALSTLKWYYIHQTQFSRKTFIIQVFSYLKSYPSLGQPSLGILEVRNEREVKRRISVSISMCGLENHHLTSIRQKKQTSPTLCSKQILITIEINKGTKDDTLSQHDICYQTSSQDPKYLC
ncbi:hypothetical protein FGO68_gene11843 [Halteria grandinella]|uniref:Uncharacterized protein n=1 Tax=Halteria grandinella TaxID=5974 RepID=A0A8J8T7D7_HALGN|nr:hypothetical protein FGO68_gene11843 [Halteria grandinella]